MIHLDSPFVELAFYFSSIAGGEAIRKLFHHVISYGATCEGTVLIHSGQGLRTKPFLGLSDLPFISRKVKDIQNVESLFSDADVRVMQIMMNTPSYLYWTKSHILAQLGIYHLSCADQDNHPIALWFDGSVLSHASGKISKKERLLGERTLEAFRFMVSSLTPDYAAITVDYGLECPCDIIADPHTFAFQDFYLSKTYIGNKSLDEVRRMSSNAYHEETDNGQITCSSEWIAPNGCCLSSSASEILSFKVGQLIANKRREKGRWCHN